ILLATVDDKSPRFLFQERLSPATYSSSTNGPGWILHGNTTGQLYARSFNLRSGAVGSDSVLIAEGLPGGPSWSATTNGLLAFRRSHEHQSQLSWMSRDGRSLGSIGEAGNFQAPRLSPDQKSIVSINNEPSVRQMWMYDIARGVGTRFTSEGWTMSAPV